MQIRLGYGYLIAVRIRLYRIGPWEGLLVAAKANLFTIRTPSQVRTLTTVVLYLSNHGTQTVLILFTLCNLPPVLDLLPHSTNI